MNQDTQLPFEDTIVRWAGIPKVYTTQHDNLRVVGLTREQHKIIGGAWYAITSNDRFHASFVGRESLHQWLADRSLRLTGELATEGIPCDIAVRGVYLKSAHLTEIAFYQMKGREIKVLDHGNETLGIATCDDDGIVTINHLHCSIKDRPEYPAE